MKSTLNIDTHNLFLPSDRPTSSRSTYIKEHQYSSVGTVGAQYQQMRNTNALSIPLNDLEKTQVGIARKIFSQTRVKQFKNLEPNQYTLEDFQILRILEANEIESLKHLESTLDNVARAQLSKIFPDQTFVASRFGGIIIRNNHFTDNLFHEDTRLDSSLGNATITVLVRILSEKGTCMTMRDNCTGDRENAIEVIKYKIIDNKKVKYAANNNMLFITCADAEVSLGEGFSGKPHAIPESNDDARIMYLRRFSAYPNTGYNADYDTDIEL